LSGSPRIAIVAALEREVRALIEHWQVSEREYQGRKFKFFENDRAVLVCGGMGAEAARRACEAVIALYQPSLVVSAGFAGALQPQLSVGYTLTPRVVVDASDGSRTDTGEGSGVLVSLDSVASPEQKAKLAKAYGAQAVDMEAAAVARGAEARGVRFRAIKVISDTSDFAMPPVERLIHPNGQFQTARFVFHVALRPWLWGKVRELAGNSARASTILCQQLDQFNHRQVDDIELGLHPIGGAKL
jgi:adenosylhomocysteine nucleosidase